VTGRQFLFVWAVGLVGGLLIALPLVWMLFGTR
jgi:hypothetical protein